MLLRSEPLWAARLHLIFCLPYGLQAFAQQELGCCAPGFWERSGAMTDYIVPLLLLSVSLLALRRQEDAYDLMLTGAADGLKLLLSIVPALVFLLTAVSMLRASGAITLLTQLLSPIFNLIGIPPETAMLVLIRPISGSAALAVGSELMATHGVDSTIGRTTAVMLGSTETTFYAISVYFGAAGIRKTRYTIPAALIADFVGFLVSAWSVRIFF